MGVKQAFDNVAKEYDLHRRQIEYLRCNGFSEVNTWYKNYSLVVYSGIRQT